MPHGPDPQFIADIVPALMAYVDTDQRYRWVNAAYESWFGQPRGWFEGRRVAEVIGIEGYENVRPYIEKALSGEACNFETRQRYAEGWRDVLIAYRPVRSRATDELSGFVVLISDLSRFKQVQSQVAELGTLLDEAMEPILVRDAQDRITLWNRGAEQLYGWKDREALGRVSHDLLATKFPEPLERIQSELRSSGRWKGELVHRSRDGHTLRVLSNWLLTPRADGPVVLETNVDVTERIAAEEALRKSEARLSTALDHLGQGVIIASEVGDVFYWNPAALAMHGYFNLEEARAPLARYAATFELWTADGRRKVPFEEWPMPRIIAGEHLRNWELLLRRPDRKLERRISYSGSLIETGSGERLVFLSTFDVTEERRGEQALRESAARFRATFELAAVGIAHVSLDGRWLAANERPAQIVGYTREELLERTFQEITYPEDLSKDVELYARLIRGEIPTYSMEKRYIHNDGHLVWINLSVSMVRDEHGNPVHAVSVIEDVSERKAAQESLRELALTLEQRVEQRTQELVDAYREMEAFTYSVSHDLRAPLRGIQGMSQAVMEDYGEALGEKGREELAMVVESAQRMNTIITDLLQYSKISRTALPLHPVVVSDAVSEARKLLDGSGCPIQEDCSPRLSVLAHRQTLVIVLSNLISNGCKFVEPGAQGSVRICAEERSSCVRISIEDNGIGIAPEHQERIFNIFERLHGYESYSGTGIGLAIVKRAVERMHGHVGVESELGKGSKFWIELPKAGTAMA